MSLITPPIRKRLICLIIGLFFLFALLVAQFYQIQINEGEKWSKVAVHQHFFTVKEPFQRGRFFSNTTVKEGHPELPQSFVIDIQKFHLYADSKSIPAEHRQPIASHLLNVLNLSVSERMALPGQLARKSRSRRLAMWLERDTRDAVLEWWNGYARDYKLPRNALFFVSDYHRSYPFGKMLGQVLHTIQSQKEDKTQRAIPTGGLELTFDSYLQGKLGKRRLMRSPRNAFETGKVIAVPKDGADIYLTINHCLQAIAEEELAKGVQKCKAKSGWAVMLDPYNGHILALAQYPFFYPPDYQEYFNHPEMIEDTRVKAICDANEPGSVMKPLTLAVALQANRVLAAKGENPLFSPTDKIACSNGYFKGRSKPLSDTHPHPFLNMEMAVQKSANIYMARLMESVVNRLGKDWYRKFLADSFGLGQKTGIELPAESAGVLPTPGKKHPNGALEWSAATPFSLAIGHNVQVTSMQLARAYAIFANGGYLIQPTLIRKIVKKDDNGVQEVLVDHTTEDWIKQAPRVVDAGVIDPIVRAMKYVTKTGGTAPRANIWGYTEAGKTGTPNKIVNGTYSQTLYCSTFVGFTPLNQPKFVLLVTMDEPEYGYIPGIGKNHHGGNACAPVFREIASRSLAYLGIPPDDPHGYPSGDPRYDSKKADWVSETSRLQEMYESWNNGQCR